MKRFTLILAAAAMTAVSVPASARAQTGCSWWDLTCNGLSSRIVDYGWHMTNRDPNGNVVYFRRRVDSNGNVIFEQARRDDFGRYLVQNNYTIRKGTIYGANGTICKYSSNAKGYTEDCKYAKPSKAYTTRYEVPKPKPVKYEAAKVHTVTYKAPKVHDVKIEPAKSHPVKYDAPKGKEDKAAKGPKH